LWLRNPLFRTRGEPVLWALAATMGVAMMQSVAARVLYGIGKIRLFARLMLLEALVNLVLSVILVRPLGIFGVALGTAIPNFVMCLIVLAHVCRMLDVNVTTLVRASIRKPALTAAGLIPLWLLLAKWLPPTDRVNLVILIGIGVTAFAFAVLVWNARNCRNGGERLNPTILADWKIAVCGLAIEVPSRKRLPIRIDRARNASRDNTFAASTIHSASAVPGTAASPCRPADACTANPAVRAIAVPESASSYAANSSRVIVESGQLRLFAFATVALPFHAVNANAPRTSAGKMRFSMCGSPFSARSSRPRTPFPLTLSDGPVRCGGFASNPARNPITNEEWHDRGNPVCHVDCETVCPSKAMPRCGIVQAVNRSPLARRASAGSKLPCLRVGLTKNGS